MQVLAGSVSEPKRLFSDPAPDPDPTFQLIPDPAPYPFPDPGQKFFFKEHKIKENFTHHS